jgi:hypothetical protein
MKIIRFTSNRNLTLNLSKVPLSKGLTLLDAFIIKSDGFGSYLYELTIHSSVNDTINNIKTHIDSSIKSINESDIERYNITLNYPELIVEHKKKKCNGHND